MKDIKDTDIDKMGIPINDDMAISDLPDCFKLKIKETLAWANADIEDALEVLDGQEEHNAIIMSSTKEDPAPHKDVALIITKEGLLEIVIACRVFDVDKNKFSDETKILSINTTLNNLDKFVVEELKTK